MNEAGQNKVVAAAIAAHQANKAYCEGLDDASQVDWADAPNWQHDSVIAGVQFVQENPNAGPDAQHNSWLAQKEADGWVYGRVKDAERKTHPCMVPYGDLPFEQRVKDQIFGLVVRGVLGIETERS